MSALAAQRCLHHHSREAVARCLECSRFFCRECITEHDERVVCANCLLALTRPAEPVRSRGLLGALMPWLYALSGLLVAWMSFYFVGRTLLAIPSTFHARSLWQQGTSSSTAGDKLNEDE